MTKLKSIKEMRDRKIDYVYHETGKRIGVTLWNRLHRLTSHVVDIETRELQITNEFARQIVAYTLHTKEKS